MDIRNNNDDDDDMADLFSFGSGDFEIDSPPEDNVVGGTAASHDLGVISAAPYRSNSDESFLDLLEDSPELLSGPSVLPSGVTHDAETQEILAWLDEEKPTLVESELESDKDSDNNDKPETTNESLSSTPAPVPTETVVALPPVFHTLVEALASSQATVGQIKRLAAANLDDITPANRPGLYARLLVSGKSLDAIQTQSSLVDAFHGWQSSEARQDELAPQWLQLACDPLAERVAESLDQTLATQRDKEACRQDLIDVLQYHMRGLPRKPSGNDTDTEQPDSDWFIPPVAATFLGFGIPAPVTSVLLTQVMGQHMPVLALQAEERWEAAQELHQHLYWLACYHLPLLVFHLDRYVVFCSCSAAAIALDFRTSILFKCRTGVSHSPSDNKNFRSYWSGWCAPRVPEKSGNFDAPKAELAPTEQARNVERRGLVPPSWLVSFLAGDTSFLPVTWMGRVWDWILTSFKSSIPFFLTLAVLERAADDLILLTGEDLKNGLIKAFSFDADSDWIDHWWSAAQALQTSTPSSVLDQLEKAVDESVQQAVLRRQKRAEADLKARLEAERQAHQEAQERKAEEARFRLNRARLVAFYRTHAPDKEGNIDQILQNYGDRLQVLDAKLFKKYGESFNPVVKENPKEKSPEKTHRGSSNLLGFGSRLNATKEDAGTSPVDDVEAIAASKTEQVSVLVKAEEVLPVVCWSKEAAAMRGANRRAHKIDFSALQLKFFVVDSRSEEAAAEQGRFPTSVSLSPETMLDPEKLQKAEEQFESLRGAVHIVVLGSGFSAIPKLYNQKLTPEIQEAMKQDDSRTNICALFFFKKGFPFVSILDGGFAAAHSWLVREGASHHLDPQSVLIDYDAERSLFGQMETLHNASATEKASRAMQNLMEKSLVAMALQARQIEKLASDMEQGRGRFGMSFLTSRTASQGPKSNDENKGPRFVNPFTNKSNDDPSGAETSKGPRFGGMFGRQKSAEVGGPPQTAGVAPKEADTPGSPEKSILDPQDEAKETENNKAKPPVGGISTEGTGGGDEGNITEKPSSEGKPTMPNPFRGIGTTLNTKLGRKVEPSSSGPAANADAPSGTASNANTGPSDEAKRGRFGGFSAAFQGDNKNSMSGQTGPQAVQNMLKRNPFRGFGGGAKKSSEDNKKAGGFGGGLNSLRGFGRIRSGESEEHGGTGKEESVTFD